MTAAQFRARAERIFRKANPDAVTGRWGRFLAVSPGHRTRLINASVVDGSGMSVR